MARLAKKIKQRRHKIDVTDWLRNGFGTCLTKDSNQQRNMGSFLEHCFFPEQMMRAQAVAMIACVHNDRVFGQVTSFKTGKDGSNALIHQRNQAKVTLFDTPIFLRGDAEKQLSRQSLSIQDRFRLLPFAHQTIPQWNILTLGKGRRHIEFNLIKQMLIVEGSV